MLLIIHAEAPLDHLLPRTTLATRIYKVTRASNILLILTTFMPFTGQDTPISWKDVSPRRCYPGVHYILSILTNFTPADLTFVDTVYRPYHLDIIRWYQHTLRLSSGRITVLTMPRWSHLASFRACQSRLVQSVILAPQAPSCPGQSHL